MQNERTIAAKITERRRKVWHVEADERLNSVSMRSTSPGGPTLSAEERAAVIAALNGPAVTAPTRTALLSRLDAHFERQFLSEEEFARLRAVAVRLVPHDPAEMDLSGLIDQRLHHKLSDGWRYADTPADGLAYQGLLSALPGNFEQLSEGEQDAALHMLQADQPHPFEDLLAELTEGFMAHPLTQYRFGYAGFMDAPGWPRVGPNELEAREISYGPLTTGESDDQ